MKQYKNIALYETIEGVTIQLYKNRNGAFVVQNKGSYAGREFDTEEEAISYIKARMAEAEFYNRNES